MKNTSKARTTHAAYPAMEFLKFAALASVVIWLLARGSAQLGYYWQWYRIPQYLFTEIDGQWVSGPLLAGLTVTLRISAISLVLATLLGLLTAILRLSNSFLGRLLARVYLETVRNTPLLVQLFFIYFVAAPVLDIGRFTSAVLALSLFEGAYASEIFRAGIVSIHRGQWEASYSLGLNTPQTYHHIILPQAIRNILPPLASQAISLIKDSALVSTIAIYDLTMQGQAIVAETFLVFEVWFVVAAIYLVLTVSLSMVVNHLEKRLRYSV
ncbi:MAG: amino acid ABC transporter permease [Desulfosarcina sp.]|nr:amino acid ABC transporter permease [Desulfobacterales bacterium]